jgi:hypothetical protein
VIPNGTCRKYGRHQVGVAGAAQADPKRALASVDRNGDSYPI